MKRSEDQLCLALAERVKESSEFMSWILSRTKFREHVARVCLLHEEQMKLRPRKFWWRHWWCHIPELKKDRETDIFMVFQVADSNRRFALHIENKRDNGKFAAGQAEDYRIRAQYMANKSEYLNYQDFETVLIAPIAFMEKYSDSCSHFDLCVSYEDVAAFIPEYQVSRRSPKSDRSSTSSPAQSSGKIPRRM